MKMTLNALNIEHFKGIKRFGIAPSGANLSVTGRNKLGKTTIYDAFLWLLFGKNSAGETKFTIKPTGEPAETENVVEAQFAVDGKPLLLKKVYASKYIKTTGEYKGSELEYYINGVPKKKNEYEAAIADIIDEEQFKLLTNPKHFTEVLDWKKRREILFSLAETKSDGVLAAENPEFAEIQADLETMGNASELLKAVSAQVKKNSERINILPKLINENSAKLVDVPVGVSESWLANECERLKNTIAANNEKIGELKAWKPTESPEYRECAAELQGLIDSNEAHKRVQTKAYEAQLNEAYNKKRALLEEQSVLKSAEKSYSRELQELNGKKDKLTEEQKSLAGRKWEGGTCPTCGQALPKEKVEANKANFDRHIRKMYEENSLSLADVDAAIDTASSRLAEIAEKLQEIEKKISEIKPPVQNDVLDLPEFEERHKVLSEKLEKLSSQPAENPHTAEIEQLAAENSEFEAEIAENMGVIEDIRRNADLNSRIDELKAEQAHLREEQAKLQKRLDLANAFVRYKTDMITDSINGMFQTVKFKLFEPNKTNDGLQECCEAVAFGAARYGDINTAGKILAGIDIIGTLSERYGLSVPLFVDNIDGLDDESFTALTERVKGKMQLITLRVSEDTELRTEEF